MDQNSMCAAEAWRFEMAETGRKEATCAVDHKELHPWLGVGREQMDQEWTSTDYRPEVAVGLKHTRLV